MYRWWIVLVLTVASATAWAQPGSPAAVTVKAQEVATASERRVLALNAQRNELHARWEGELRAIDRLKQQRKSWRQERELKDRLSQANETATALARVTRELATAQTQLAGARRVLVGAIDSELAGGASGARAEQLARLKSQLVPQVKRPVRRIVLPNLDVDPNADPEDLDQQASALRDAEAELQRQIAGLEKQSKDLERVVELRKSHDRAIVLDRRDDSQPSRNPQQASGGRGFGAGEASPQDDAGSTTGTGGGGSEPPPSFEAEASIVLSEVVDPSTIDSLSRAQRSGDPGQRLKAAAKTRDAVKAKLELLRQKRALVEQRAKQLRK
ncbi:MAG: hypothetical protein H0T89_17490 [Deltaproteobacteria bacterium]|nr:hypothetical protein [Deltaproteobacteria bacterium]MDQ3297871.1 hypothetical protein [Myxococcota bacterium]